jgi:hypothetical protein
MNVSAASVFLLLLLSDQSPWMGIICVEGLDACIEMIVASFGCVNIVIYFFRQETLSEQNRQALLVLPSCLNYFSLQSFSEKDWTRPDPAERQRIIAEAAAAASYIVCCC